MKLKKLTPYYKDKVRRNLRMYFDLATTEHIRNGMQWYATAYQICESIEAELDNLYDVEIIAAVISALSPRNKWDRNIIDAKAVLSAVMDGLDPDDVSVCTFSTNKLKAFEIAKGSVSINRSSRKTFSFVQNIAHLDENYVTIDVWHLRAMFGKTVESGLTPARYDELAKITIEEAKQVGLTGYQYQAIIWECIRDRDEQF